MKERRRIPRKNWEVPSGRPSHTTPIPIKPEHLEDVHKFFPFILPSERAEWEGLIANPAFLLDPPAELPSDSPWFPALQNDDAMEIDEPLDEPRLVAAPAVENEVHPTIARVLEPRNDPPAFQVENHPVTELGWAYGCDSSP